MNESGPVTSHYHQPSENAGTGVRFHWNTHLIDSLIAGGHHILCIDEFNDFYDPNIKQANIAPHRDNPRFTLARADIRDRAAMRRLFADHRPEIVIHLAARAGVRPSLKDPFLYHEVNTTGTLNLLDAAVQIGIAKFIFGSSSSVYGKKKVPFSEKDPLILYY